jgi:hypothetical protein
MEQEDPNFDPTNFTTSLHEVRLLVTHDSPHQGANTPLSLQHTGIKKYAFAKASPKSNYS